MRNDLGKLELKPKEREIRCVKERLEVVKEGKKRIEVVKKLIIRFIMLRCTNNITIHLLTFIFDRVIFSLTIILSILLLLHALVLVTFLFLRELIDC